MKMKQTLAAAVALATGLLLCEESAVADAHEATYDQFDTFITPGGPVTPMPGDPTQPPCPGCSGTPGTPTDPDEYRDACEGYVSVVALAVLPGGGAAWYGARFLFGLAGYNVSEAVCDYLIG